VRLGHVALDGTKVKAYASKHKAMSYRRMCETEARLSAEVAAWFERGFLLRGLRKVRLEWRLVATAHDLRKLVAAAA
jgi:hypothetical protein